MKTCDRIQVFGVTAACLAAMHLLGVAAAAQQPQPDPLAIPANPLVEKLIDDPVIGDAERRRLLLFFGQWDKVEDPTLAEAAAIALARYDLSAESLRSPNAPVMLRARAALLRGEPKQTIDLLADDATIEAALLGARALDELGKTRDAIETLEPWRRRLNADELKSAADLTAGAEALVMLARLEGRPAHDYEQAMRILARARSEADRLYWPAYLAEARILFEKDNPQGAFGAVRDVLALNPHHAEAWAMLGRFLIERFEFELVERVVERLRQHNRDHLLAAIIEGHMYLTQKDAALARAAVEPMLANYPNQRELLALLAAIEAMSFRDKELEQVLAHFDKLSGENPMALVTAGSYLSHARQYPLSEKLLRRAVERRPNWPQPRIELGLMLMQAGKEDEALKELRLGAQLDPFNTRARNQLRLVEALLGYDHIATGHFVIKYRHGIDEVLARDMARQVEEMFGHVTGAFEHKPANKTLIEIMPDEQWFGVRITGLPEIWTIAACTGDVIAMTPPRDGPKQRGTYDWLRVLQHEYTHTVTLDQTKYRIPHWFTEAAAVAMEPGGRDYEMADLLADALGAGELFDLHEINWGFIRPRRQIDRPLAYAQAHWMFEYITHRFGHETILDLMRRYRAGESEVGAIAAATQQTADQFMSGFRQWATKQVESWGLAAHKDDDAVALALEDGRRQIDDAVMAELLRSFPDHPAVLHLAARRAMDPASNTPRDQARVAVLRYAAARPIDPWVHEALYTLAVEAGQTDDAVAALNQMDRAAQDTGKWAHELAVQYRKQGDFAQATRAITRALHREPYNADYRELAAAIAIQHRDMDAALHHVVALTLLEPTRAMHQVRLAALYSMMNKPAEARQAAEAARKIDPDAPVERFLK